MAFQFETKVRTSIGLINIQLRDYDGDNKTRSITAKIDVHDQNGLKMDQWSGDLRPHLQGESITATTALGALAEILDIIRDRAGTGLLP